MQEYRRGDYLITTDKQRLDPRVIHQFLAEQSYWAQGRPVNIVQRSIDHSLCFGVFCGQDQIGFARVITDYAIFAYLADVFILEAHRGQGLSKWLMACIMQHPDLQGLRSWLLATADAHRLYAQYGFTPLPNPEFYMTRRAL